MDKNKSDDKINKKLKKQQGLDKELIAKSHKAMNASKGITTTDLFVFGAVKRILSNSDAFQKLIVQRNFSTCAALLRMQIDTAMRLNAMTLMDDLHNDIKSVLFGEKQFNRLKDKDGNKLTCAPTFYHFLVESFDCFGLMRPSVASVDFGHIHAA